MSLTLNETQKRVLQQLSRTLKPIDEIITASMLPLEKVQSILGFFLSANLAERQEKGELIYQPTEEGQRYLQNKLPEQELIDFLQQNVDLMSEIKEKFEDKTQFNLAIMWAKKNNWVTIEKGKL